MAENKRVLYVTRALIAPPHAGCMIRALNICRQLKKQYQVTLLAVSQTFNQESVLVCQKEFEQFHQIHLKPYSEYPLGFGHALKKWHMHWPYDRGLKPSEASRILFLDLAASHDIVWFHTIGASLPFKINQTIRSVMDLDDLNQCKYEQLAQIQPRLRLRLSAAIQAYKWKRHEKAVFKQHSRIVVCSEHDKQYLNGGDETCIVPNGYTQPEETPQWTIPNSSRIGFIGLLAYGPNRDGLLWFRDHVWPQIRKQKPNMCLRVIGKKPSSQDYVEGEGFEYTGYLEDTTEEMKTWSSLIVPIPYGGGTRIKILDAFSKKCPVIATTIGAYGIEAVSDKHILIADDPKEFAQCCLNLSDSPQHGKMLTEEAWKLFTQKYTWDEIGKSVRKSVENL